LQIGTPQLFSGGEMDVVLEKFKTFGQPQQEPSKLEYRARLRIGARHRRHDVGPGRPA
jgi:hypothetical protein